MASSEMQSLYSTCVIAAMNCSSPAFQFWENLIDAFIYQCKWMQTNVFYQENPHICDYAFYHLTLYTCFPYTFLKLLSWIINLLASSFEASVYVLSVLIYVQSPLYLV